MFLWDFGIVPTLFIMVVFLFVGASLGFIAFFKTRRLQHQLNQLNIQLQMQPAEAVPLDEYRSDQTETDPESQQKSETTIIAQEVPAPIESPHHEDEPAPQHYRSENKASLEERLGTRWTVWVGGFALVLGGIFMVRYSIETGLLTPAARIAAGALLAIALAGAGELLRRNAYENKAFSSAYIPGVLTLAGITTAFATIFSAHALYGLIGPSLAFILLAATAILTLFAAILHGPAIASYGLLASYGVPFLVSSDEPAIWPLAIYGLTVSAAAYGVARLKLWRWFAIAAAAGSILWGHVIAYSANGAWDAGALIIYDLATFAMAAFIMVISLYPRNSDSYIFKHDWLASGILFLHGFLVLYLLQESTFSTPSLVVLVAISAALLLIASEWPVASGSAIAALLLMSLAYMSWDITLSPRDFTMDIAQSERISAAFANPSADRFPYTGMVLAILGGSLGLWGTIRSNGRWALSTAGVAVPLTILAIAYFRIAPFETSVLFGGLAIALALIYLTALRYIDRSMPLDAQYREYSLASYAIGTIGAIAGSMAILLGDGWLPIGLSLLTLGIVWVYLQWRLVALPWLALSMALLTCVIIWYNPTIVAPELLSKKPVFNALLYGYGVPSIMFVSCAYILARLERSSVQQCFEGLAVFAVLTTFAVIIHHAMNGGTLESEPDTLAEWSLYTIIMLAAALAVRRLNLRANSRVLEAAVSVLGVLSLIIIAIMHLLLLNPLFTGEPVGNHVIFNLILVAYLIPALLLCLLIRENWHTMLPFYRKSATVLAGTLTFAWLSLQIRAVFHRPRLDYGFTSDAEFYTYSAVWLAFGIILLLMGWFLRSNSLRIASGIFVLASVAKVFLLDMAGLDGVWRALSFIGLGLALIGIGLLYQNVLRSTSEQKNISVSND